VAVTPLPSYSGLASWLLTVKLLMGLRAPLTIAGVQAHRRAWTEQWGPRAAAVPDPDCRALMCPAGPNELAPPGAVHIRLLVPTIAEARVT
jgi:hypothetical protein